MVTRFIGAAGEFVRFAHRDTYFVEVSMTTVRRSIQPIHRLLRLLLAITTALVLNSPALASLSASTMASGGQTASAPAITPQFVYVGNHDSKDLSVFHINAATGKLSPIAGSPFRLETAPTSVVASPNGEFLFVAGDTSAGVFAYKIDSRGAPQAVEDSPFEPSESPHQFVVDHSGNHLYATSKESGSVLAFAIDAASGKLTAIAGSPFSAGRAPPRRPFSLRQQCGGECHLLIPAQSAKRGACAHWKSCGRKWCLP
jgi:6-phosphogluconolactonase (cycloisomerase 2 family)